MVNLNQSNTPKSEKDYWRTPNNLINDAIGLLNTWQFSVDVCAKDADTSIGLATAYIDENIDALSPLVEWDENYIVKNERYNCKHLPMFCNPPFSKKWEFFQKAIEQSKSSGHNILMVMPYTPATRAWHENVINQDCIIYVPDGRYQFLLPNGERSQNSCSFETCLILIVPFKCGNVIVNYKRGL
ncbi:DNA N-6-adenine-methyltransferase [Gilliamella apicola]|uniref:DNA N-6-adenine-methyltransferase n=1 Tax=Gilliamella apicola TaxID=1196095 RepID=UPI0039858704